MSEAQEAPTSQISPSGVGNHLRKGSVVITVADLRRQSVVPTAIPGETKRTEPLKNNGDGRKNLLRVLSKQININRTDNEFKQTIEKEITKESVLKGARQDKIVDVFFKDESPYTDKEALAKFKRDKKIAMKHIQDKKVNRGNLNFFMDKSNFKEPACLAPDKTKSKSKYDEVNTRLVTNFSRPSTAPGPVVPRNTFMTSTADFLGSSSISQSPVNLPTKPNRSSSKPRVSPHKTPAKRPVRPETTLLPYPQDIKNQDGRLNFTDVWKKAEPKDIFPHVNSFQIHENSTAVPFAYSKMNPEDGSNDLRDSATYNQMNTSISRNTAGYRIDHDNRRMSSWTCLPTDTTKTVTEMLDQGMSFKHARKSVYDPGFSSRFGVKKVDLFDVTVEEEVGLKEEFRSRYSSVLDTIQNESSKPLEPRKVGDIPPLGKVQHEIDIFRTESEVDLENNMDDLINNEDEGDVNVDDGNVKGITSPVDNTEEDSNNRGLCHSPRNALIRESVSRGLIPFRIRELLDVEDIDSVEVIDMKGQGVGDDKMCAVVQSLPYFTNVVELNVSDNRLTDKSIEPLLNMVLFTLSNVKIIDLSANKMDQISVDMLNNYVSSESCRLQELRLNKSDVDDIECANMMNSMSKNKSIKKLFLSNNFIGVHEDLNAVHPEYITGPEAIATMLIQNDVLVELDVSWNSIRGESAITLGQSLTSNNHLISLNLAYNSIGDSGAQQLAHSLRFNASLKHLDVSFNHLGPKTALVFSQVLDSTDVLTTLNMNGNCPGIIGGRALLRSIRIKALEKKTLVVNLDKANLNFMDDTFDRQNPSGDYLYDMESPYGYAVVCILFEMASTKPDARFLKVVHGTPYRLKGSTELSKTVSLDNLDDTHDDMAKWKKVDLVRGPSENDKANEMWKQLIKDLVITQKEKSEAEKPKDQQEERKMLSRKLFGTGSVKNLSSMMMVQKSKRSKAAETANENTKDYFALEKICLNFDLFPEDEPLQKIAQHFSTLPTNKKDALHKIVKEIFVAAFKVAETFETSDFRLAVLQAASRKEKSTVKEAGGENVCDVSEITKVLTLLGWKQMTPTKYQYVGEKILKSLDLFGRGVVYQTDFIRLMFLQFTDSYAQTPGALIDNATGMVWEVPTSGFLKIKFYATTMPPSKDSLVSEETIKIMTGGNHVGVNGLHSIKSEDEQVLRRSSTASRFRKHIPDTVKKSKPNKMMAKLATIDEDFAVTAEQADVLLAQLMSTNENPLSHAVETILPQVATPMDACRFLASNLTFEQLMLTRDRMDNAFRTVTGIGGGHYLVDLSKKYDRQALKKLSAASNLEKAKRFGSDVPFLNTSQSANNENFRNSCVNGKPRTLTTAWLENLPSAGKIRFDYVNTERMVDGVEPITDHMFNRIMDEILFCDDYRERLEKEHKDKKAKIRKKSSMPSPKKQSFAPPPMRKVQSVSVLDIEKEIGVEEDSMRNTCLTGKDPLRRLGASSSFDMHAKAASDDSDTDSVNSKEVYPSKRIAKFVKRRKKSLVTSASDTFRFFNAVKGQTSVARRAQLHFQYLAYWTEIQSTNFETYMAAYKTFLGKKLQAAKDQILAKRDLLSDGAISESLENNDADDKEKTVENLQAMNELKFLRQIALYHLTYRLGRIRPYFLADIFPIKKVAEPAPTESAQSKPVVAKAATKLTYRQRKSMKNKKRPSSEDAVDVSKVIISVPDQCVKYHDFLRAMEVCLVYQIYFSAKQVSTLVDRLRQKRAPMLVIVNFIQLIFSRIINLVDFSKIVSKYPNDLKDELFHRIGILNIWTPVHPDGTYRLNLSAWDNREAAKMLFKLAAIEPGENLINETYRPSLIEDNIPGWELPMPWTLEGAGAENLLTDPSPYRGDDDFNPLADGCTLDQREGTACRRHGFITFEYTSDPKKGCVAHMESRVEMMKERTLGGYKGIFTNDLANLNQPKKRIKQQRAVRIVGAKLKKLAVFARAKVAERHDEDSDSDSSSEGVFKRRAVINMFSNSKK